ncbi:DUF3392 domain-containing protein [Marinomonas sp. M1K-6]|uniref:DUF3392 domain-containing protein n=1 Tax=Marinomonas profundi TaxID=2726122 RepID=A0A847RC60_9GAMM|nr:DUF3392 domain-containing protein [Marinomonas profundi]NLQ17790.1 DUF3392 domain-containing protein [Marinomonas profundi]UDV04345.1 DUF3392 domain-containing protein [Marinomonas profundi]
MFIDLNLRLAHFMQPYLQDISLALVATCLVIYGDKVNASLKKLVSSWVFIARVMTFILMCTFGYGLLTLWSQPLVYWGIVQVDLIYRPALVVGCFCFLGILAERKRHL